MNLIDLVREECVSLSAGLEDKEAALKEVARLAKQCDVLADVKEEKIVDALYEREGLGSTGFGGGIAIPHCRLKAAPEFVVGLISVPKGVDFDASDGQKVTLIAFIVGPETEAENHIRLLSTISQALSAHRALDELSTQTSPAALRKDFLKRFQHSDEGPREQTTKSLFHVFVQNEDYFRDILQILTATPDSSTVVVDSENTSEYLARMPLFEGFWRDRPEGISRIVVSVIDKRLANETVRRIESITGSLDKTTGIMVIVQNLAFAAGSIGA